MYNACSLAIETGQGSGPSPIPMMASELPTVRTSEYETVGVSDHQNIRLLEYRTVGVSDRRIIVHYLLMFYEAGSHVMKKA